MSLLSVSMRRSARLTRGVRRLGAAHLAAQSSTLAPPSSVQCFANQRPRRVHCCSQKSHVMCYGLANPSAATHAALKSKSKADAQANTLQALDAWRMRRGSLRECACPNAAACTGACARTNGGRGTGLDNAERQWVPANIRRPRTHFYTDAHANAPTYGRAVTRPALPGVKVEPR